MERKSESMKIKKYFIAGIACFLLVTLDRQFSVFSYVLQENADEFVCGVLCGLGILFECCGLYNRHYETSLRQKKIDLINSLKK